MDLIEDLNVREIFLGVSPTGIRVFDPTSLEPDMVVDELHVVGLSYATFYGNPMLKMKYLVDHGDGKSKVKKKCFYVLPVTAQDILYHFENCAHMEENEVISELPKFKVPKTSNTTEVKSAKEPLKIIQRSTSQMSVQPSKKLIRGHSEGSFTVMQCEKKSKPPTTKGNILQNENDDSNKENQTQKNNPKRNSDFGKDVSNLNTLKDTLKLQRNISKSNISLIYDTNTDKPKSSKVTHV